MWRLGRYPTPVGVKADGVPGPSTLAAIANALGNREAGPPEIPDEYWPILAKIESGDRLYIKGVIFFRPPVYFSSSEAQYMD